MASITTAVRFKKRPARPSPFDVVGAAALIWAAGFLALAFALGVWLR